jgi:hypothetical protein
VQCGRSFIGAGKTCDDDCRSERQKQRKTSPEYRHTILKRILESEKVFGRDDRLIWSLNFYTALIENGCTYCQVSLENFTGICLDRLQKVDDRRPVKHNSWSVTPCCPTCNRLKSDSKEDGFSFMEMGTEIGPAVKRCRICRGNLGKK